MIDYNNTMYDKFFDMMKKVSDKYNLGLEDGFAISSERQEIFIHLSFTSNISMKISTFRLVELMLNYPEYIEIEYQIINKENALILTTDKFISINSDNHLFILVNDQIGDAPIDIVFEGYREEGGKIYVNKFRQSDIFNMKCIGLKFVFNKLKYATDCISNKI